MFVCNALHEGNQDVKSGVKFAAEFAETLYNERVLLRHNDGRLEQDDDENEYNSQRYNQ